MRIAILAAVGAGAFVAAATADETTVPLDKVPKAVLETVKKRFPKAELVEAAKETEGDKTVFKVTLTNGDAHIDATLTPEGVLTMIETTVPVKSLPKAVADALAAKYPKATLKLAEEVVTVADGKETLAYSEVLLVTADEKTVEVEVAADGKVLKTEDKKAADKD